MSDLISRQGSPEHAHEDLHDLLAGLRVGTQVEQHPLQLRPCRSLRQLQQAGQQQHSILLHLQQDRQNCFADCEKDLPRLFTDWKMHVMQSTRVPSVRHTASVVVAKPGDELQWRACLFVLPWLHLLGDKAGAYHHTERPCQRLQLTA